MRADKDIKLGAHLRIGGEDEYNNCERLNKGSQ